MLDNYNYNKKEPSEMVKELANYAIEVLVNAESPSQIKKDMKKINTIKKKYKIPKLWYSIEENSDNEDSANDSTLSFAIFITLQEPQSKEFTDIIVNSVHYVSAANGEFALSHRKKEDLIFDDKTGNIINTLDLEVFNNISDVIESMCYSMIVANKINEIEINEKYISRSVENFLRINYDIDDVIILAGWDEEDENVFNTFYRIDMNNKEFFGNRYITEFFVDDKGKRLDIISQIKKEMKMYKEDEEKNV